MIQQQRLKDTILGYVLESLFYYRFESIAQDAKGCVGVNWGGVGQKHWMMMYETLKILCRELSALLKTLVSLRYQVTHLLLYKVSGAFHFHHRKEYQQEIVGANHIQSMEMETEIGQHSHLFEVTVVS
jgi:hypothetical protein